MATTVSTDLRARIIAEERRLRKLLAKMGSASAANTLPEEVALSSVLRLRLGEVVRESRARW